MKNRTAAMAAISPIAVLLLLASTGCFFRNSIPSRCTPGGAHREGIEQAMQGKPIDYSGALACEAEHRTQVTTSIAEGYREGKLQFCDPPRVAGVAREEGEAGTPPGFQPQQYAICSNVAELQIAYDQGHNEGVDLRCRPAPQVQVGRDHGSNGQPAHFDAAPFAMCGEARVQEMTEAYARGHQAGVAEYCAPEQWEELGLKVGRRGDGPHEFRANALAVCSAEQREIIVSVFERGYQTGLARYCAPERWESAGLQVGDEGNPPENARGALAACSTEQRELALSHHERGYQAGLARYCLPASWEPTGHSRGVDGRRTPDVSDSIRQCSPTEQSGIAFHVRRGYEAGLRTYCDGSGIANAAREAAREGNEPVMPDAYVICLDVFPDTQVTYASAYQTELAWMQQRWGGTPPMPPARFRALLDRARELGPSGVMEAARNNYFTSQQVLVLMHVFYEHRGRVEIAVALYPVVVDRENWEQIYGALASGWPSEVRERIAEIP